MLIDSEESEDAVLGDTQQFADGMVATHRELASGETVSLTDARAGLEAD
jgi:hypothetical protein